MGTLKVDKIVSTTGDATSSPITLSGDTATLGSGVTLDSGITGIPAAGITGTLGSGVFPVDSILQTKLYYATDADLSSTSGTLVSFGMGVPSGTITITSGNNVLVTVGFQVYTGGNKGGYVWMCRGIKTGTMTRSGSGNWNTHADCMNYVTGMTASDPHMYNTSGGHSYSHFTYKFLDTWLRPAAATAATTDPRYCMAI